MLWTTVKVKEAATTSGITQFMSKTTNQGKNKVVAYLE